MEKVLTYIPTVGDICTRLFAEPISVKEVSSTQDVVKQKDFPTFTPFVAQSQTRGRGRRGNSWYSPPGKGLYLSFKLPKGFLPPWGEGEIPPLSLVVGLSVSETVDSYILSAVKWPNDVYIRGKKVAGTLVEADRENYIVGIGVNLNTLHFPPELGSIATSIYRETGVEVDFEEFLNLLLENLSADLLRFKKEGFEPFVEPINRKLLWRGKRVVVDHRECGKLLGIDPKGYAVVKTCFGKIKRFPAGEISLRPYPKR